MIKMGILVIFLFVLLWLKQRQIVELEKAMKAFQKDEVSLGEDSVSKEIREDLCQSVNAIYLYASLSEEAAKSPVVEENQQEIIKICEHILEKITS